MTTTRMRSMKAAHRTWYEVRRSADAQLPPELAYQRFWSGEDGLRKVIYDTPTPRFAERRAAGQVILNDCTISTRERSFSPMSLSIHGNENSGGYSAYWSGDYAAVVEGLGLGPGTSDNFIEDQGPLVLLTAYSRIRTQAVMSGELLAGLAGTIRALKRPFSSLQKALKLVTSKALKKHGKTARTIARANADAWLEGRYVVQPAMIDCRVAVENALDFTERVHSRRIVVRAGNTRTKNASSTFQRVEMPPEAEPWLVSGRARVDRTVKTSAGVILQVNEKTRSEQLAQDFMLGTDSVVPTLWELTPYSFVADWFFNVGDWLAAMSLPPGLTVMGNWCSSVDTQEIEYTSSELYERASGNNDEAHGSWGGSLTKIKTLDRRCNLALATYPVAVTNWSTVTHAADAMALLTKPILRLLSDLKH